MIVGCVDKFNIDGVWRKQRGIWRSVEGTRIEGEVVINAVVEDFA